MKTPIASTRNVPIDDVQPHPDNPRRGDIEAIASSLDRFGQYRPIVVQDSTGHIIAGNHTWIAAKQRLHWRQIKATFLDVDDDEAKAIMAADNRLSDRGDYEPQTLADLLTEINRTKLGLEGTGYEHEDLDVLLAKIRSTSEPTPAAEPKIKPRDHKTRRGDVWHLGRHRLIIGDARDAAVWDRLLAGADVNVAVTSPPYAERRDYDAESGFEPIPPDEYVSWFEPTATNLEHHLAADGSLFLNIKPHHDVLDTELYVFDLILAFVREWGWHFATELCWERSGVPMTPITRFKNQFEPVYQLARNRWKFRPDNVRHYTEHKPKGPGGTFSKVQGTGDEWFTGESSEGLAYPGNRLPTFSGSHEATGHDAAFPVGLPRFFIEAYTDEGDTVVDPFVGSGSTILAAEETDRIGYGIEISPDYANTILTRWNHHHPTQVATKQ